MPLTHITKGIGAEDICRSEGVGTHDCKVFGEPLAYFFYGRPAYRISGDGAIKVEAACPYCFVFKSSLINQAKALFAFDTGAFDRRLYKHILMEEMNLEDFSLEQDRNRPNRIIASVFGSRRAYFEGDTSKIKSPEALAEAWEFHARAYLHLLASPGRNEPDDRICSIEVLFGEPIPLAGNALAVVVPHTVWDEDRHAPWLEKLQSMGIAVTPYIFVPGRHPDYYHALLEAQVRDLFKDWGAV
jgi:hypothetical protein